MPDKVFAIKFTNSPAHSGPIQFSQAISLTLAPDAAADRFRLSAASFGKSPPGGAPEEEVGTAINTDELDGSFCRTGWSAGSGASSAATAETAAPNAPA